MDYISGERAACLFKWATREPRVVLLLHSANVRVTEVRLLSLLGDLESWRSGGVKLLKFQSPKLQEAKAKKIKPSYRQEALAMGVSP